MRILMTNHFLYRPGGSETWTLTVNRELVRRGHEVEVYAVQPGLFAERSGMAIVDQPRGEYDLALVNHNSCLAIAAAHSAKTVMTCHGVYPDLEQPTPGASRYVAVSEEVREHLRTLGYRSDLIRNPIDCVRFSPTSQVSDRIRRVLSLCQGIEAKEVVRTACASMGVEFLAIEGDRVYVPEALINDVDLVAGLGRTAMEAMACGRNVLVLDSRDYAPPLMDGLIDASNVDQFATTNFSGRCRRLELNTDTVLQAMEDYDPAQASRNRGWALRELGAEQQVDRYLSLADEIATPALHFVSESLDRRHLHDKELFRAMYEEVGSLDSNKNVVWRAEWMSAFLPEPGSRILELGSHNGPNLVHYARLGHRVDGVEISTSLIATFDEYVMGEPEEVRERIRVFNTWIEGFVPDMAYDYVLVTEVLEHVADPITVLESAARAVKADGRVYITSPDTLWGNNTHVRAVVPDELREWLDSAGLVVQEMWQDEGRTYCWACRRSSSAQPG